MFNEKNQETPPDLPRTIERDGLRLTLDKQVPGSREGEYVLVIENLQNPDKTIEVYLDEKGKMVDSRSHGRDGGGATPDMDEIRKYIKQFPQLTNS